MIATFEISMYPLTADYERSIIRLIQLLDADPRIEVKTNAMSTYLKGEFIEVWSSLGKSMETVFKEEQIPISNIIKLIPRDLPIEGGWLKF